MQRYLKLLALFTMVPAFGWAGPVNINLADAATLSRELKGIGETRAEAIVAYRKQHGPFKSVDELGLVKGIGKRVIEQNRANLRVDQRPVAPVAKPTTPAKPAPRPRS